LRKKVDDVQDKKMPNTPHGKKRSRFNATKHGIFSSKILLRGESREEYEALWNGLRKSFQPEGTAEEVWVERLTVLLWRERRFLDAERAEIDRGITCGKFDSIFAGRTQEWELLRAGETAGGMLRDVTNPLVIETAIRLLKQSRDLLEKFGFERGEDPWRLRKLYGLDHDRKVPLSIYLVYLQHSKLATDSPKGSEPAPSPDELKKQMIEIFNEEIERLEALALSAEYLDRRREEFSTATASIPSKDVLERLLRYATHWSREIERTLDQLERMQRARVGKPVPRVVLDLNAQS
jgi:hypothetical protein